MSAKTAGRFFMRILHVTPYWADAWAYGGIPRVVGAIARQQASDGHHVTVCTTDAHSRDRRRPTGESIDDAGIDLRVFPNRSNRLAYDWQFFTPAGLHRYLRDHAHEFDVAHLHACRNLPVTLAAHYLDRYDVPYVLAPNGTAPIIERRRLAKRVFDWAAGHRILRNAAALIAVSGAERHQLLSLGASKDRIHLVPNPIDVADFTPPIDREGVRRRRGCSSAPVIAFLGKITPRKRLDVLVRAFARLTPNAQLVIAGNDMGGLDEARTLARRLGVDDRVRTPGLLAGRERLELLAAADVVVYPSEDEIFGLVALESILTGTPVVVAGDSGCGEVVSRVGGGLLTPAGDAVAVADAIDDVLSAPDGFREAATAAAFRIRNEYSPRAVVDRLLNVYAQVARSEPEPAAKIGVTFVVPVKNGMATLPLTLASIQAQADGRPLEIIVVDDRSEDRSAAWLSERARVGQVRLVAGAGRGVSAALNLGVGLATHPVVCQVDQDVELLPGWLSRLVSMLEQNPELGAVEGHYTVDPRANVIARAMALDLEQRYAASGGDRTDHVCTGNTAFRLKAIRDAGGFDETLGYGNDADMSRRLRESGWRLAHCRRARSFHAWRDTFAGFLRQQYGFGYGRVELVSRDARRVGGDRVAPPAMMAHPLILSAGLASFLAAAALWAAGMSGAPAAAIGIGALGSLIIERAIAGVRASFRFGHAAALLFPVIHLARDLSWVAAMAVWSSHRVLGRSGRPADSMRPRSVKSAPSSTIGSTFIPRAMKTIGVIPSHNEAATIGAVIADVRSCRPDLDLLVVDDGSTDGGTEIVARAGVRLVELPERMGVGTAMRAGLRYARRLGYDSAVRLDADGQHRATDIDRLLAPIVAGEADVVLGSRFLNARQHGPAAIRLIQRGLAASLSFLTNASVTDPTSGFCALGPRALRLLADEHPTGYPEPEIRLLLSRHALTVVEVPVESRPRLGGRTTLTALRLATAGARVLLAMVVVPLRRGSNGGGRA